MERGEYLKKIAKFPKALNERLEYNISDYRNADRFDGGTFLRVVMFGNARICPFVE